MPKRKQSEAVREAYLAGLQHGSKLGEDVAGWLDRKEGDMAIRQVETLRDGITRDVEEGAKPWEGLDEPIPAPIRERATGLVPPSPGQESESDGES